MAKKSKEITVIIPVHKFDDEVKTLLTKAVESIDKKLCDVIFVGPNDVLIEAKNLCEDASLVVNNGNTDVYTQINTGVMQCFTPYFTVLEYDDEFLPTWSRFLAAETELSGNMITLPFCQCLENETFRGFANEIAWDAAFVENHVNRLGYIAKSELYAFSDFNITGGIIKTEDFISVGKLNPDFKLFSWYEFLVRCAREGKKIYIVPRVCYTHRILREGSYMSENRNSLTKEEASDLLKKIWPHGEETDDIITPGNTEA